MGKEWYQRWFNEYYSLLYPKRNDEEAKSQVEAVVEMFGSGGSCLDIACGSGRHLFHLSRYFKRSVGLDLSAELIKIGTTEGNFRNSEVFQADMRVPPFTEKFDLVTNFFNGFGYFRTDLEHQDLLCKWSNLVAENGILMIDYLNKDRVIKNLVPRTVREVNGHKMEEVRSLSEDSLRVEKSILICGPRGSHEFKESVRMYDHNEMKEMLVNCKYRNIRTFGDFSWSEFLPSISERLILVAKK